MKEKQIIRYIDVVTNVSNKVNIHKNEGDYLYFNNKVFQKNFILKVVAESILKEFNALRKEHIEFLLMYPDIWDTLQEMLFPKFYENLIESEFSHFNINHDVRESDILNLLKNYHQRFKDFTALSILNIEMYEEEKAENYLVIILGEYNKTYYTYCNINTISLSEDDSFNFDSLDGLAEKLYYYQDIISPCMLRDLMQNILLVNRERLEKLIIDASSTIDFFKFQKSLKEIFDIGSRLSANLILDVHSQEFKDCSLDFEEIVVRKICHSIFYTQEKYLQKFLKIVDSYKDRDDDYGDDIIEVFRILYNNLDNINNISNILKSCLLEISSEVVDSEDRVFQFCSLKDAENETSYGIINTIRVSDLKIVESEGM